MKRKDYLLRNLLLIPFLFLAGCTYNPFMNDNHTTGSIGPTVAGTVIGAGTANLIVSSPASLAAGGVAGGMIGYYVSTLRFDAAGIIHGGGQIYQVGDLIGISIPSDRLFMPNTGEFTYQAASILDSVAAVLKRFPNNNIIISGNTSGFGSARWERKLSLRRAQNVAAYLWYQGINEWKEAGFNMRKLNYVGYGDYFPIANTLTNDGIRANSRIQITSYPNDRDLGLDKRHVALYNIGGMDNSDIDSAPDSKCDNDPNCYAGAG